MKKLLSYLFLLVSVVCLAACTAVVSVDSLQVSGQKTGFVLGEEFSTGEMTVIAIFTNGNEEDVTSKVTVTPSTDMSAAGNFSVEVYYEGCTAKYNIVIEKPELVSIEVNHESVAKSYLVGQELSTAGLEVVAHYTNSFTGATQEVVEPTVVVKNAAGEVVEGAFEYVGEYTVSVEFGGKSESFTVTVSNEFASVAEAVAAGVANAGKVVSGSHSVKYSWADEANVTTYEFGKNYFTHGDEYGTYHYSEDVDGSILCACESWGDVSSYSAEPEAMNGLTANVLYYTVNLTGAEGFVGQLYALAVEAGYVINESVSEGVYSYSYKHTISEVNWDETISYYYYNVSVSFKLGSGAEISEVTYVQSQYYEENVVVAEDGSWTVAEGAVADDETTYSFVQVAGERTAENPYAPEKVKYQSFDLVDVEGNASAGVYETSVGLPVTIYIGNALPETANSVFNTFEFVCEEGYIYAYASGNTLNITCYSGGTFNVTITCGEIVKQVTITATVPQPESVAVYASEYMESWWGAGYEMMETQSVTVAAGGKLYIGGGVYPSQADQSVTISLKEEYADASLSEVDYSDLDAPYFEGTMVNFNSNTLGTYVVVITSVADSSLSVELTVTVVEGSSSEEPEGSAVGLWTAVHPMNGMFVCSIDVYDGYATFSDGGSQIMMGCTLNGTSVEFQVGVAYQGTLAIEDVVVSEDFSTMTATVTYMGTTMSLTFTK